jgi:hypothetical protein
MKKDKWICSTIRTVYSPSKRFKITVTEISNGLFFGQAMFHRVVDGTNIRKVSKKDLDYEIFINSSEDDVLQDFIDWIYANYDDNYTLAHCGVRTPEAF